MTIKNKYDLEDEVYLRTDPDQKIRLITEIAVKPGLFLVYQLSCGEDLSHHYEFEISRDVDTVLKTK